MLDFLHHLFLPRESNNHRAKILHHQSLLLTILLLFTLTLVSTSVKQHYPDVLGVSASITPEELLTLTNQERQAHGVGPLTMDSQLTQAATLKAQDMFAKNYWAHNAPDGTTPWYFIKLAGYDYNYAGENLARGFYTSSDVVTAWMNSPSHRENMLSSNYQNIGFAIQSGTLTGDDTVLVVEEFGTRLAQAPSQTAQAAPTAAPVKIAIQPVLQITTVPTEIPTPTPTPFVQPQTRSTVAVAAMQTSPLVNSKTTGKDIAIFVLVLFILVLAVDMIIVKRNNIVRAFTHNLDHIIFLTILLIVILIISGGRIL